MRAFMSAAFRDVRAVVIALVFLSVALVAASCPRREWDEPTPRPLQSGRQDAPSDASRGR